jgi:hypothetical protein
MHNIYKKYEDGTWGNYTMVLFPDGQVMDEDNHDFERNGFFWSDEPPQEYLEYIENNTNFDLNK